MDKIEAVRYLKELGKDATLEDGVVMLRSRATGVALDREYKAMETYQAQVNVTNTKFQPLGDPQEHEIFTSYGQTLTFTEIVVEDGEFITDLLAGMKSGEMPSWNFQGVIKGRNGSEERLVYNDCVPSGNIDLQNVTVGDLIKRQWSLFVNGAVNQQGKLRA